MPSSVSAKADQRINPARRIRRTLWSGVILLALIGIAVALRRTITLVPILVNGYHPPAPPSNAVVAQFAVLDDIFARYPILTLIHIIPGVLFMLPDILFGTPFIQVRTTQLLGFCLALPYVAANVGKAA